MGSKPRKIEYVVDENGCHICTSHSRYKVVNGKTMQLHTYVYKTQVLKGKEIPKGMVVAHTCDNEKCINLDHLTLITRAELNALNAKKYLAKPIEYEVDPVKGCHICTSHPLSKDGYPRMKVNGKTRKICNYLFEKKHGKIPKGLVVRHKCDNRRCINLDHLCLGTQGDNVRDMIERDRQAKGSRIGNAKLTEEKIREIKRRLAAGDNMRHLARIYEVSYEAICNIKYQKTWKHVIPEEEESAE